MLVDVEPSRAGRTMQPFDCGSGGAARERYERFVEKASEAGALTEQGRSTPGGHYVSGGHPWNSDHVAVVVEGAAWAADDQTRRVLSEGQGVVWPAGEWFAVGSDGPCEVLRAGAKGLSVDRFFSADGA